MGVLPKLLLSAKAVRTLLTFLAFQTKPGVRVTCCCPCKAKPHKVRLQQSPGCTTSSSEHATSMDSEVGAGLPQKEGGGEKAAKKELQTEEETDRHLAVPPESI